MIARTSKLIQRSSRKTQHIYVQATANQKTTRSGNQKPKTKQKKNQLSSCASSFKKLHVIVFKSRLIRIYMIPTRKLLSWSPFNKKPTIPKCLIQSRNLQIFHPKKNKNPTIKQSTLRCIQQENHPQNPISDKQNPRRPNTFFSPSNNPFQLNQTIFGHHPFFPHRKYLCLQFFTEEKLQNSGEISKNKKEMQET